MKKRVRVGKDFNDPIQVYEAKQRYWREVARTVVAITVVFTLAVLLIGAAIRGVMNGSITEVAGIWASAMAIITAIVFHYFRRN